MFRVIDLFQFRECKKTGFHLLSTDAQIIMDCAGGSSIILNRTMEYKSGHPFQEPTNLKERQRFSSRPTPIEDLQAFPQNVGYSLA